MNVHCIALYLYHITDLSDDDLFIITPPKKTKKEKETTSKTSKSKGLKQTVSPKLKPVTDVDFFGSQPVYTREKSPKQKKVCLSYVVPDVLCKCVLQSVRYFVS